jgi:hypothetical protein
MARTAWFRLVAALAALITPGLLAACGNDSSTPATPAGAAANQGEAGAVISPAQAEQAVRDWWRQHELALTRRDQATQVARLDAAPLLTVVGHQVALSLSLNRPVIPAPRTPSAVRVYVPPQPSWPVSLLAVVDVASRAHPGATEHVALLFTKQAPDADLRAIEQALLDSQEPAIALDANGYARTIPPADQPPTLGRSAADLSAQFGAFMGGIAHGHPAPAASFAPGPHTTQVAEADAAELRDPSTPSHGVVSSVDLGYLELNFPTPVYALSGGGGFTLFATERDETLHPGSGQDFVQDASRHNWGIDVAPGQYQQIAMRSIVVCAVRLPEGGAPADVVGSGGGVYSAG